MQATLDISTIFVNYVHFYVNAIMLTEATKSTRIFIVFDYYQDVVIPRRIELQDVVLQHFLQNASNR